jgi:hypothetical protein
MQRNAGDGKLLRGPATVGGVCAPPALDPLLRTAPGLPRRLDLSVHQVDALVAFMEALIDSALLRDGRLPDPFPGTAFPP